MRDELETGNGNGGSSRPGTSAALRVQLSSGVYSVPLRRLHHLAGYATLVGEPNDYLLGWLVLRGEQVPVFDLNLVVCDEPTSPTFGSRIMVLQPSAASRGMPVGLLAAGATDTIDPAGEPVEGLDLDSFLPMLYSLIPDAPDSGSDRG